MREPGAGRVEAQARGIDLHQFVLHAQARERNARSLRQRLTPQDAAIVMQALLRREELERAVLVSLECAHGISGHAARASLSDG